MPLTRPSQELSEKNNVNPSVNRQQEATAEDFNEVGTLFNEYADAIEILQGTTAPTQNVGSYTTLALLTAAYPTGAGTAFAIIDAGAGQTPSIAIWDATDSQWEISGTTTDKVYVNSFAVLPQPGIANTWYITTDFFKTYLWYNNQYNITNPDASSDWNRKYVKQITQDAIVDTSVNAISFIYNTSDKVTDIIFSTDFTPYLAGILEQIATKNVYITLYNITQSKSLVAKITSIAYTDNTDTYYKAVVETTIDRNLLAQLDELFITFSISEISSTGPPSTSGGLLCFGFTMRVSSMVIGNWYSFNKDYQNEEPIFATNTGQTDLLTVLSNSMATTSAGELFVAPTALRLKYISILISNGYSYNLKLGVGKNQKLETPINTVVNPAVLWESPEIVKVGSNYTNTIYTEADFGTINLAVGESFVCPIKQTVAGSSTVLRLTRVNYFFEQV